MRDPLVRNALREDLGRAGDLTSDAIVPADARARMRLVARQPGVLAGLDLARIAFGIMDQDVDIRVEREDGARLRPGDTIATVSGRARAILRSEEHTSELQSLMRISYAVFCLKKKKT